MPGCFDGQTSRRPFVPSYTNNEDGITDRDYFEMSSLRLALKLSMEEVKDEAGIYSNKKSSNYISKRKRTEAEGNISSKKYVQEIGIAGW